MNRYIVVALFVVLALPAFAADLTQFSDAQIEAMRAVCYQHHASVATRPCADKSAGQCDPHLVFDRLDCDDLNAEVERRLQARVQAMGPTAQPAAPADPTASDTWLNRMLGK